MTFDPFHTLSIRTVGFDHLFEELESSSKQPAYPPYNIIDQGNDEYCIEIALAGFSKEDIEITYEYNKLIVRTVDGFDADEKKYLHRGISKRKFTREFTLADDVVVATAGMYDGMLHIELQRIVPEHKKSRNIDIL